MPVYSRDHMMSVLAKLHWLPIRARVSFKIATTVFKVRQTEQPSYLAELIEDAVPSRTLRSSASRQCTLKESITVLCYGTRGVLADCSKKTWNSLPDDVRLADKLETFRSRLNVNVNVNICNALEFPKEQKCEYLLWSIEAKMVQVCFELRSE